jgi:SAM-dependent methyltransferase
MDVANHPTVNPTRYYEAFYAGGGWKYGLKKEQQWLRKRLVEPLRLRPCKVLDLGCGTGAHTEAWRRLGYDALGVDLSDAGVARARREWPESQFLQADAGNLPFPEGSFGVIFVRGMSWYHRELDDRLRERTRALCRLLRPDGVFVLAIRTDYSGRTDETTIIHNKLESYLALFEPLGNIALCTDWEGRDVRRNGTEGAKNIVIAIRPALSVPTFEVHTESETADDLDIVHEAILSLIPPESRVLDVACGTGILCRKIKRRRPSASVTGIDASAYAIKRNTEMDRNLDIEYIRGDVRTGLDTLRGDYDVVILHDIVEHLDDAPAVTDAAAALLCSSGLLIITCPHDDGVPHAAQVRRWGPDQLFHLLARYGRRVSFQHFDPPRQECLLVYVAKARAQGSHSVFEDQLNALGQRVHELKLETASQRESIEALEEALQRAAAAAHQVAVAIDRHAQSLDGLGSDVRQYAGEAARDIERLALVRAVRADARRVLPSDATVFVVSRGDDDLLQLGDCWAEHFPQDADGSYAGHHPADGADATLRLAELRKGDSDYVLFPATAFWWLDFYTDFRSQLEEQHRRVWADEHCVIYRLAPK